MYTIEATVTSQLQDRLVNLELPASLFDDAS